MPRVRRVCVIGAGVSGLACALAAAEAGCEVDVCDAAASPVDTGAQVDLGPNAVRALAALGVAESAAAAGFAYQGIDVVNERGERLFEIETPRLAGPRLPAAVGLGRDTLRGLLAAAAERRGARLHAGVRIDVRAAGAERSFAEPLAFSDRRAESADLVVLAAGQDAPLRQALFPAAPAAERFAQHWWQALLPRPRGLDRAAWVIGPLQRRLLLLPVSVGQVGIALPRPAAALDGEGGVSRGESLRAALAFASALLPSLEGRLDDADEVSVRPIRAALLPPPWHRDRVLCVGECAHALPPHFGQVAAQSLEDAVVLGDLLRQIADRDALVTAFSARRAARAGRVHALVSQAARWDERPDIRCDLRALAAELDRVVSAPA